MNYLSELRDRLLESFNESELEDLCFDLGVNYEILSGKNLSDKARELIAHQARRGKFEKLINRCQELRPKASWEISVPYSDSQYRFDEVFEKEIELEIIELKNIAREHRHLSIPSSQPLLRRIVEVYSREWFTDFQWLEINDEIVLFNPDLYEYIGELLTDLYVSYLAKLVGPFTYGEQWVIYSSDMLVDRVVAPLDWLLMTITGIYKGEVIRKWITETRLEDLPILSLAKMKILHGRIYKLPWKILFKDKDYEGWPTNLIGIAVNSEYLAALARTGFKGLIMARHQKFIIPVKAEEYKLGQMKYEFVVFNARMMEYPGKILIESEDFQDPRAIPSAGIT